MYLVNRLEQRFALRRPVNPVAGHTPRESDKPRRTRLPQREAPL
jgi:hypothetical protein